MSPSSRTPDGDWFRCLICGDRGFIATSPTIGDATCPSCGALIPPAQLISQPADGDSTAAVRAARERIVESLAGLRKSTSRGVPRQEVGEQLVEFLRDCLAAYGVVLWWPRRRWWRRKYVLNPDFTCGRVMRSNKFAESVASDADTEPLVIEDRRAKALRIGVPVTTNSDHRGVIEVLQRPGARRGTRRGYVRFVQHAAAIISESEVFQS